MPERKFGTSWRHSADIKTTWTALPIESLMHFEFFRSAVNSSNEAKRKLNTVTS